MGRPIILQRGPRSLKVQHISQSFVDRRLLFVVDLAGRFAESAGIDGHELLDQDVGRSPVDVDSRPEWAADRVRGGGCDDDRRKWQVRRLYDNRIPSPSLFATFCSPV